MKEDEKFIDTCFMCFNSGMVIDLVEVKDEDGNKTYKSGPMDGTPCPCGRVPLK